MRFALFLLYFVWICASSLGAIVQENGAFHVYPVDQIQDALEMAARNPTNKLVRVHAGEYRPNSKRQALVWFNRQHDGIRLEAVGPVTLSAANPTLSDPSVPSHPAVVNHVVYFGDGISSNTVLQGFRITGANGFVTKDETQRLEPSRAIPKNYFFYSDGGAIKVFGRSYPVIRQVEVVDNFASPCGGGISVQHQGFKNQAVVIEHCVFLRNRAQGTGAAIDLLAGSAARIEHCLFVGNVSNVGEDPVAKASGERPFVNNGVVTVFWRSRVEMRHCTVTGNRNGVDDMGGESSYVDCVFAGNTLEAGLKGYSRYELAVNAGAKVTGCLIHGKMHDVRQQVSAQDNRINGPMPQFDRAYVLTSPEPAKAGYRPLPKTNSVDR